MSKSFELFPAPPPAPSPNSPFRWAGISPESTAAMQETLQSDYEKYHVFFNDRGFHNHGAHAILATWALGASGTLIRAAFEHSAEYQRPAFKSPEPITAQNVFEHLGDEKYYNAYLAFFKQELEAKGFSAILEEYVFSPQANLSNQAKPQMLNRFFAGLLHPLIHVGYGAEFGLPGMIIEGMAQTAVHSAQASIIPPSAFETTEKEPSLASRLSSLVLDHAPPSKPTPPSGVHALTILARIIKDPKFKINEPGPDAFRTIVGTLTNDILAVVDDWVVDATDPKQVEKKIEELALTNVLMYAVAGYKKDQRFFADFFLMHLVTSSLFLSSLVPYLSPPSQARLLKSYFTFCLAWFISRGCPTLDIEAFFAADTAYPSPPGPEPKPHEVALAASTPYAANPNPWLPIIQNALIYPDEHLPKLQRALAHYSAIYGSRVAGEKDLRDTELPGAEKIDGSLFIRAAGLTDKRMGRVHSGEKPIEFWDRVVPK